MNNVLNQNPTWNMCASKAVFTWYRIEFHSGTTSSRFHTEYLYSFTWYQVLKISFRKKAFQNEFILVIALDWNFCSGTDLAERSGHKYHVRPCKGGTSSFQLGTWIGWADQLTQGFDQLCFYRTFIPVENESFVVNEDFVLAYRPKHFVCFWCCRN